MSTTFNVQIIDMCIPHIENKKICNVTNLCYHGNKKSITLSWLHLKTSFSMLISTGRKPKVHIH